MPTTPVSVSTGIPGLTNTTIYTVPVGKTAIVKAVIGQTPNNNGTAHTVSKSINGQNFPLNYNQSPYYTPATGGTVVSGANLISAPVTMAAGEQLKVYVGANSFYNFPSVVTDTNQSYAADGSLALIRTMNYGNSIYMATGYSNSGAYVATSPDAITWTQKTSAVSLASNIDLVAYANGVWVGAKQYATGNIFYSADNGNTWSFATGVSSYTPYGVYSGNNTIVISAAGTLIYSTNGSTWTESTALTALLSPAGYTINGVGWTGTHWIVSTGDGSFASTDLVSWNGFGSLTGNTQGYNNTSHNDISYSSYYGKYYAVRNAASVPNIFSSSTGLLWNTVASVTQNPAKVAIAGNNPVIIACPTASSTTRYKSTDGITFTAGTDSQGYVGRVWGLENGYFLTFSNPTQGSCYLSTDPVAGTGTTFGGGSASDFTSKSAAADPITGKWMALGKDVGSNRYIMLGGTSGTNIGPAYVPSGLGIDSTRGNPMAVAWSAADSAFYMVSDTGQVRRATSYDSFPALVNSGTIQQQYNAGTSYAIKVVGTTIYVFLCGNPTYGNYVWIGSTLTGGTSFTTYNLNGTYGAAYWRVSWLQSSGIYAGGDTQVATNGTYLLTVNGPGTITAYNPSVTASEIVSPPTSLGTVQVTGSYGFSYGGALGSIGNIAGLYYSTNIVTTFGRWTNITNGNQLAGTNEPPNKVLYLGGTYYVNAFNATGYMYAGTTPATLDGGKQSGSTIAGVTVVQPNTGFTSDGTNMVGFNTRIGNTMKTTTPSSYLYGSTVTASIVEIS